MDNIQFLTRKEATCQDLLSCLYNLKPTDLQIFQELTKNQWTTLDFLAEAIQKDRSSTHRSLSKLVTAGLVYKQSRGLKNGGYYHVYSIVDPEKIKEHARQRVRDITSGLELLIDKFDSDLTEHMPQAK